LFIEDIFFYLQFFLGKDDKNAEMLAMIDYGLW